MSKQSRYKNRERKLSRDGLTPTVLRDSHPGINIDPDADRLVVNSTQVASYMVESVAIHSKSGGWLPAVSIEIVTAPLMGGDAKAETFRTVIIGSGLAESIARDINFAMKRSIEDCAVGYRLD